eukprot:357928-Chlamydomonas_euryale.AAC.2
MLHELVWWKIGHRLVLSSDRKCRSRVRHALQHLCRRALQHALSDVRQALDGRVAHKVKRLRGVNVESCEPVAARVAHVSCGRSCDGLHESGWMHQWMKGTCMKILVDGGLDG